MHHRLSTSSVVHSPSVRKRAASCDVHPRSRRSGGGCPASPVTRAGRHGGRRQLSCASPSSPMGRGRFDRHSAQRGLRCVGRSAWVSARTGLTFVPWSHDRGTGKSSAADARRARTLCSIRSVVDGPRGGASSFTAVKLRGRPRAAARCDRSTPCGSRRARGAIVSSPDPSLGARFDRCKVRPLARRLC